MIRTFLIEKETAYHGSAERFDVFQTDAIGIVSKHGQVYGWGLYFAKDKNTAKGYTPGKSSKETNLIQNKTFEELSIIYDNPVFLSFPTSFKTIQEYIDFVDTQLYLLEDEDFEGVQEIISHYQKAKEILEKENLQQEKQSYLYTVILFPNKEPDYLQWNKKVPEYQIDKITKYLNSKNINIKNVPDESGHKLYDFLTKLLKNSPKSASLLLLNAGIDGITHSNDSIRIIFDPQQAKIIKRDTE